MAGAWDARLCGLTLRRVSWGVGRTPVAGVLGVARHQAVGLGGRSGSGGSRLGERRGGSHTGATCAVGLRLKDLEAGG